MDDDSNKDKCPESVKDPDSSPDKLTETIMILHWVFVACTAYAMLYFFITSLFPILAFQGFNVDLKFPYISVPTVFIAWVLFILSTFVATLLFVILFWIFIHWLIIIFFVPIIIIFPIPIFPFIFILPLQPLMLELIPPFKVLTNTGTLPTMLKISKRLFSEEIITDTFNYFLKPTGDDLNRYFYANIKQMISEIFYYDIESVYNIPPEKCKTSKQDIINSIKTEDNSEDEKTYKEYKEISSVQKSMDKISEDTELCVSMHHKFKAYNSSYTSDISTDIENTYSPYNSCYTGAIKSYLKTSITE
jgi:hypothetical protein